MGPPIEVEVIFVPLSKGRPFATWRIARSVRRNSGRGSPRHSGAVKARVLWEM